MTTKWVLLSALLCPAQTALAQAAPAPSADPSVAQPAAPTTADAKTESGFDKLWGVTTLYQGDKGDTLNELRITGRLHLDYYRIDSDNGDDHDLVARRARLGLKAKLVDRLEAAVEGDFDLEGTSGPFFIRFTDAWISWKFSDAAKLTVGKHPARFTLDGGMSANELLTIDRSNVANNFWFSDEYAPGISLGGKSGAWSYNAGVYSGGRKNRLFGDFKGGAFFVGSIGHDFAKPLGVKKALVRVDYVHNEPDVDSDGVRPFRQVGTLAMMLDDGKWGFNGELTGGNGWPGQSDAFGITATPWLSLSERLQLVGRYTFLDSETVNGLRLARYDNVVTSGRGDRYNEFYAGLNYYIYGNKLKLQTGLARAHMRDRANDGGEHKGLSWTSALRLSW